MTLYSFIASIEVGLVFSIMALGVFLTFRVLDFPDLTVDGSFPLGAGTGSVLVIAGVDPWLALLVAFLAGSLAGVVTAVLNVYLGIFNLLASIITMTALYSINLRVMGRPNISLLGESTIFTPFEEWVGASLPPYAVTPIVFFLVAILVVAGLSWFLSTEIGLALRATGNNGQMARAMGVPTRSMTILGLALSNGLVALSGGLYAQAQGSADIGMGVGTIIAGLVSVIIGEAFIGRFTIAKALVCVAFGSIVYRLVIGLALSVETGSAWYSLRATDLNLITATLVVTFFAAGKFKRLGK